MAVGDELHSLANAMLELLRVFKLRKFAGNEPKNDGPVAREKLERLERSSSLGVVFELRESASGDDTYAART